MKQLSGLDAAFLFMETEQMPMHVGALHLLELPAGFKGDFAKAVREHLARRLHLAPVLSRRLVSLPLNVANPAWMDLDGIDLNWHVQSVKLPKPGGMAELEAFVGQEHAQVMDRTRPLWQFFIVTGLSKKAFGGHVVALYTKVHHAAVDGKAGVALANAILDITPVPREVSSPGEKHRKVRIGVGDLLRSAWSNQLDQASKLLKTLPSAVSTLSKMATSSATEAVTSRVTAQGRADRAALPDHGGLFAPRTSFNGMVSDQRAFAVASLPLSEVKGLGKGLKATVNDLVLMLVSGALRRYLKAHGPLPRESLVAAVPVSLRAEGDTSANTQATITLVPLATQIKDPAKRLAAIKLATASMKDTVGNLKDIIPMDFPSLGVPWLMQGAVKLYGATNLAKRMPPFANVAISNVPGPPIPLYLAGAKMLAYHPVSIITHGIGLNVTVQSYNGMLDFGCIACGVAMPDVKVLADALLEAFEELKTLPPPADEGVVPAAAPIQKSVAKTPGKTAGRAAKKAKPQG